MKSILVASLVVCGLGFSSLASAADHPAVTFIKNVGVKAVELGSMPAGSSQFRGFCSLVQQSVTPEYIAPYVLGDYYPQATARQMEELKGFLIDMVANHISKAFSSAPGGELKVFPRIIRSTPVGVNAELYSARGFRVYKFIFFVQNGNKIVDARVNPGVMISKYLKNEYTRYMDRHGGNAPVANLLDHLAGQNPACP